MATNRMIEITNKKKKKKKTNCVVYKCMLEQIEGYFFFIPMVSTNRPNVSRDEVKSIIDGSLEAGSSRCE
jgi:hypothetical protein